LAKIGKKTGLQWLLPIVAVPAALAAEVSSAAPWLEKSETAGQAWDDLPFLGPPQRRSQRQPSSPETRRQLETRRELQRELHRRPEVNSADQKPAATVFPPPRLPTQARTTAPPSEQRTAPQPSQPSEARTAAAPAPKPPAPKRRAAPPAQTRTVTARTSEGEQELQRELNRALPATAVLPVGEPLACAERLAKIANYSPLPSRTGPNGCGAADLVRLDSIVMPDRSTVALNPAPQIKCSMAEQFAQWVREDVGPAAAELGSPLMSISDNDAYDCRPRNGVKGAPLSEHGKGNALDLTGIRLRNGGVFTLSDQQVTKAFRDKIRAAACGRFMTVLGPGSDAYHASHVHLDMAERARKTKVCQWNVRETEVASRTEPEPPARATASAPPVAALPVVPPPPKIEAQTESKIEPKAEPKVERKVEPKIDTPAATEPAPPPPASAVEPPAQTAEAPVEPPVEPSAPQEQKAPPAAEPPAQVAEAPREPAPEPPKELTPAPPPEAQLPKAPPPPPPRLQTAEASPQAVEPSPLPRRKPEALQAEAQSRPQRQAGLQPDEASRPQAAEASPQVVETPPLPRRKPEALQVLAEAQQSDTQGHIEREPPRERRRYYDSRRHFDRDVRRFLRNFF